MRFLPFVVFLFSSTLAVAAPGLYHNPDRDGHGLLLTADTGFGNAVIWYLYRRDRSSAVLIGADNCTEYPCVTALHEPRGPWMGGDFDLGDPVGSVEITLLSENTIKVSYDLRAFDPEKCIGVTPGGVIFNECVGNQVLEVLAR